MSCNAYVYAGLFRGRSCRKPEWKDGWCKTHHPESVKDRNEKSEKRYREQLKNSPVWRLIKAHAALREIAAGNLDGETQEQFADRCVRVAKEVLR